jgi:hypothetical protein
MRAIADYAHPAAEARRGVRAARLDYADANEVFPTRGASGLTDHSRADTRSALRRPTRDAGFRLRVLVYRSA